MLFFKGNYCFQGERKRGFPSQLEILERNRLIVWHNQIVEIALLSIKHHISDTMHSEFGWSTWKGKSTLTIPLPRQETTNKNTAHSAIRAYKNSWKIVTSLNFLRHTATGYNELKENKINSWIYHIFWPQMARASGG